MPTAAALIGPKTTSLAEFTKNNSNNNSHNYYQANRPWRGRGKKGKKNAKRQYDEEEEPKEVDWDAIYDPAKPTSWKAWNISAEKYDSAYEWKEKLNQKPKPSLSSESPASTSEGPDAKRQRLSVSATPHFPQRSTSSSEEPAMRSGLGATPSQAEEQTLGVVTPEEQATRSGPSTTLPGKEGFARRMMEKMGHVKGKGLGLNQDGITQPLVHKKLGNIAVIKGGGRAKKAEDGPNGKRSEVVVVYGLLDGVDSEDDEARNDGGIRQEIGDYCANKFGILQKVHPFWGGKHAQAPVFLKFASEFDALMAVDHFNDPTKAGAFRGKQTTAKFYNLENFEHGVYE
ncbi:uncharacterized protein BDZ99DRAFT_463518 [Mytilinidion resinicola]|uniref:G-patch domain-containing protein n=1 Tax=Mytilinidion resinicola TaxID=574789 RepID=A0A6A6YP11_9PEZI|nr:uncharacterized protein BDZ99DRAFT_463518 [Mytilinidion resinicola]KAF2809754.1 hypothetical protein BDZ99DRAFT_463518 [Mytilinidion resinicola]